MGRNRETETEAMRHAGMMLAVGFFGMLGFAPNEAFGQGHKTQQSQLFSGTYLDPAIQRPDIIPGFLAKNLPEYRQTYNRPRYLPGEFLHHFEPTSQEAIAWESNVRNGNYRNHRGGTIPVYNYPKPWEVLNTRARPDFPRKSGVLDRPKDSGTLMELVEPAPTAK